MNYTDGYTASFYVTLIDPATWTETEEVDFISGSVNNTADGLRQSATLQVRDFDRTHEHWIRIYMNARQNEDIGHKPIFTGVVSAPREDVEDTLSTNSLNCYSVLEPVDTPMIIGEYIARGENAGTAIRRLLEQTPAPVDIGKGIPALDDYIIAEDNETKLTMIQKVLDAIGWQLVIAGDGTIKVRSKPIKPVVVFAPGGADVIEPQASKTRDWFKVPNVLQVTAGDAVAEARDTDPNSPLSIPARGRMIISTERDVKLSDNEGLAEYAKRRLDEEQQVAEVVEYSRRFIPDIYVGDIVQMNYSKLQGVYEIQSQTINLTYNGQTREQAVRTDATTEENWLDITPTQLWYALVMPDNKYLLMPGNLRLLVPAGRL